MLYKCKCDVYFDATYHSSLCQAWLLWSSPITWISFSLSTNSNLFVHLSLSQRSGFLDYNIKCYKTANILSLLPPCVWRMTQLKIFCPQIPVAPLKQFLQKQIHEKVDLSLNHIYLVYPPQIQTVTQELVSLDSMYHNELLFDGY